MNSENVGGNDRGAAVAAKPGSGVSDDPSVAHPAGVVGGNGSHLPDRRERVARIEQAAGLCTNCHGPLHRGMCEELRARVEPAQLGLVVDGARVAPSRSSSESQWHTPPRLADRLLSLVKVTPFERGEAHEHSLIRSHRVVLDLGGGGGALADAALRAGATNVVVVERDPEWCAFLRERYRRDDRVRVVEADVDELAALSEREACKVLGTLALADVVISNPPFHAAGVARFGVAAIALSKQGAPCAFIMRLVDLATDQASALWDSAEISDLAVCVKRPQFGGESGDGARTDFCAVRFAHEPKIGETHHGARVHRWCEAWTLALALFVLACSCVGCAPCPAPTECQTPNAIAFQAILSDREDVLGHCSCEGPTCERPGEECSWNPERTDAQWQACFDAMIAAHDCATLSTAAAGCL